MKLWQKTFLITLVLILLAIELTAGIVLENSHQLTVDREQEQAVSRHQYITATLHNRVVYERLNRKRPLLTASEIDELLEQLLVSQVSSNDGIAIYREEKPVSVLHADPLTDDFRITTLHNPADTHVTLTETKEHRFVVVGSTLSMEGVDYTFFTLTDITTLYHTLEEQIGFVRTMGLVAACVIGGILMLIVYRLLSPLQRIDATLHQIAAGDYHRRIPERGGQEFRTLAHSINQMAEAIEENVAQLKDVADNRKRFIDNLAHEMKTPLTSILGFADILRIKKEVSNEERQTYAAIVVEETKRLQALSGKLMELITAGNVALELEEVSAAVLLEDTVRVLSPVMDKQSLSLTFDADEGILLSVDRTLFSSLLYNLIDNAAKASACGQVIRVTCHHRDGEIALSVIDQGMGMSPKDMARVTEPFYMVDKARTRKAGGAGLGLALCADIAARHNATLSIDSQVGMGTTVTVAFSAEMGGAS